MVILVLLLALVPTCHSQAILSEMSHRSNIGTAVEVDDDEVDLMARIGFTHRGRLDVALLAGRDFSYNENMVGVETNVLLVPTKFLSLVACGQAQLDEYPKGRVGLTLSRVFSNGDMNTTRAFNPFLGYCYRVDQDKDGTSREWTPDVGMEFQHKNLLASLRYNKSFTVSFNYLIF